MRMSTRTGDSPPLGIALILLAGVSVVGGLIAHRLLRPASPARAVDVGATGDAYFYVLAFGMPVLVLVGIAVYLYLLSR